MTRRRPRGHGNGVRESPTPLLTVEIYVTVMAGCRGHFSNFPDSSAPMGYARLDQR